MVDLTHILTGEHWISLHHQLTVVSFESFPTSPTKTQPLNHRTVSDPKNTTPSWVVRRSCRQRSHSWYHDSWHPQMVQKCSEICQHVCCSLRKCWQFFIQMISQRFIRFCGANHQRKTQKGAKVAFEHLSTWIDLRLLTHMILVRMAPDGYPQQLREVFWRPMIASHEKTVRHEWQWKNDHLTNHE